MDVVLKTKQNKTKITNRKNYNTVSNRYSNENNKDNNG